MERVCDQPDAAGTCGAEKNSSLLVEELPTGERAKGLLRTAAATLKSQISNLKSQMAW